MCLLIRRQRSIQRNELYVLSYLYITANSGKSVVRN